MFKKYLILFLRNYFSESTWNSFLIWTRIFTQESQNKLKKKVEIENSNNVTKYFRNSSDNFSRYCKTNCTKNSFNLENLVSQTLNEENDIWEFLKIKSPKWKPKNLPPNILHEFIKPIWISTIFYLKFPKTPKNQLKIPTFQECEIIIPWNVFEKTAILWSWNF